MLTFTTRQMVILVAANEREEFFPRAGLDELAIRLIDVRRSL